MENNIQQNQSEPTLSPPIEAQQPRPAAVSQEPVKKELQKKKAIFRLHQILWYIVAVIETLLAFRMSLKAVGANPQSGFATLINSLSGPLARPFDGILQPTLMQQMIFDWSILVAAAVYALLAFAIIQLLKLLKPVSKEEVE